MLVWLVGCALIDAIRGREDHPAVGSTASDPGTASSSSSTPGDPPCDPPPTYPDRDGDGFGIDDDSLPDPIVPVVTVSGDCDDDDRSVHPGALEVCGSDVDMDCDGSTGLDEQDPAVGSLLAWQDADGDGQGNPAVRTQVCPPGRQGWVQNFDDCDDADAAAFVGSLVTPCPASSAAASSSLVGAPDRIVYPADGLPLWLVGVPGDLDGDGRGDVVVGSYEVDGAVARVFSSFDGTIGPRDAVASLSIAVVGGLSFGSIGDASGDGADDLYIQVGEVFTVYPTPVPATADLSDASLQIWSAEPSYWKEVAHTGAGTAWLQDADGDVDLFDITGTGTRRWDDRLVHLDVPTDLRHLNGGIADAELDGDGLRELVIGEVTADAYGFRSSGRVSVVPSSLTCDAHLLDVATAMLGGGEDELSVGAQVDAGPDIDGDGSEDLVVSSWSDRFYVLAGPLAGEVPILDAARSVLAGHPGTSCLSSDSLSAAGDLDGDGFGDVVVGCSEVANVTEARAYVAYGPMSGTLELDLLDRWTAPPDAEFAGFDADDINGDGTRDLIIGDRDGGVVWLVGSPGP